MATTWEHEVHVICHQSVFGAALAALDVAFPTDDGSPRNPVEPAKYGTLLTGPGGNYYGASFPVTESRRVALEGAGLAVVPGIYYWRCTNPGGLLSTTNHPASAARIGSAFSWVDCLTAIGVSA